MEQLINGIQNTSNLVRNMQKSIKFVGECVNMSKLYKYMRSGIQDRVEVFFCIANKYKRLHLIVINIKQVKQREFDKDFPTCIQLLCYFIIHLSQKYTDFLFTGVYRQMLQCFDNSLCNLYLIISLVTVSFIQGSLGTCYYL